MPINSESLSRKLYDLLSTRGYAPKPLDVEGKVTPVPEEAAVIKFDFIKDGENYGKVWASIDGTKTLQMYYGDGISGSPDNATKNVGYDDTWTGLLKHLKNWSQRRQLGFELRNENHLVSDMARRKHTEKLGENMNKLTSTKVNEGYYPMGKLGSYSDAVPTTKIILQHTRKIEEGEQRYRNIAKIFVENMNGERFLIPTTKPGIARVYARHISEGGTPYDERGKHITSLVEEYKQMAGFVRATKNKQFNESAQELINEGVNHYQSLRETLHKMCGRRGYTAYFESWTPTLIEDGEEQTNLNELFVQETLDPRIESVMPILSRLHKKAPEVVETMELANWANEILENALEMPRKIDESHDIPLPVRALYTQTYAKYAKTAGQAKGAKQMAYAQVEKKYGKDMADKLKAYHNQNSKLDEMDVAEGYWQDALKQAEADREARKGKPFEKIRKNPLSHDEKGVYKGDKDLAGNPVPRDKKSVEEASDISGLLAASNLNKSFIITAELAEGGTKKYRVKAQSERVAKEKFMKHHSMAKIVDVKEETFESTQFTPNDFKTNSYESMADYRKWMRSPKTNNRGMTRHIVDSYESIVSESISENDNAIVKKKKQ
jgi:hypothetical protein